MDKQSTTHSPDPCTHISKLTKKNLQSLLTSNYIPLCPACNCPLNPSPQFMQISLQANLCLHCGHLCCTNEPCILAHDNDAHLFWARLRVSQKPPSLITTSPHKEEADDAKFQIICRICGILDDQLTTKQTGDSESVQKLKRFRQYIMKNILKQLPALIVTKFNEYEQLQSAKEFPTFGIKNLGNTCFLNSVLQPLFYTTPLANIYNTYGNQPLEIISQQKSKRRSIQFYYDEIIQKDQAESWHVVADKKGKGKEKTRRRNLENFVPEGLVKDAKFNSIFSQFIKNVNLSLKQLALANTKQRLIYEPVEILAKISEYDSKYLLKQEQDAEELLIFLIDILSQGQMITLLGKNPDLKQKLAKVQALLGHQKLSAIQQVFGSYLASHIVCLGCNKQSWTLDFTYHYPVPIEQPKTQQKSLQVDRNSPISGLKYYRQLMYPNATEGKCKILLAMFRPERLTNRQNYYTCQKCSGLAAIKQFYIVDPPQILTVSFKRFEHNRKYKISKVVEFEEFIDIEGLVLREKSEEEESPPSHRYELYGVIVHKGQTISSGHYLCYVKMRPSGDARSIWYEFSDDKVRMIASKQVFRKEAYLLLYQKIYAK